MSSIHELTPSVHHELAGGAKGLLWKSGVMTFILGVIWTLMETASKSQEGAATDLILNGQKLSEANNNRIHVDNEVLKKMPTDTKDKNYAAEVQEVQTEYNLKDTTGQMPVNTLQTYMQNASSNFQLITNFSQKADSEASSINAISGAEKTSLEGGL